MINQEKLELIKRIAKRLPEILLIALIVFSSVCIWAETENAKYAIELVNRTLFDSTQRLVNIPLFHKILFTVPALLLVLLFAEDIYKVSIKNEPSNDGQIEQERV